MGLILCPRFVLAQSPAGTPDEETHRKAQQQLELGQRLYQRGEYEAAERELLIGQQLEALPVFFYTLGQTERRLGRCSTAIAYYNEYLKSARPDQRASTQVRINQCRQTLAEQGLPQPELAATRADAPPIPVTTDPQARTPSTGEPAMAANPVVAPVASVDALSSQGTRGHPKPWFRDPLGLTLIVGGVASLAAGGAFVGLTYASDARASYGALEEARDGRWRGPTGIALLSVGGALVIGGAIRLGLRARATRRSMIAHTGGSETL